MKNNIVKRIYPFIRGLIGVALLIVLYFIVSPTAKNFQTQQITFYLWQTIIILLSCGLIERIVKLIRTRSGFIEYIKVLKNYNFIALASWVANVLFYMALHSSNTAGYVLDGLEYFSPIGISTLVILNPLNVILIVWMATTIILLEAEYNKQFYLRDYSRTKSVLIFMMWTLLFVVRIAICIYFIYMNNTSYQMDTYKHLMFCLGVLALCSVVGLLMFRFDRYIYNMVTGRATKSWCSLIKVSLEIIVFTAIVSIAKTTVLVDDAYRSDYLNREDLL